MRSGIVIGGTSTGLQRLFRRRRPVSASPASPGTAITLGSVDVASASPPPEIGPAAPNPFRDRVTIPVSVPESGPARVAVVDARGALVRVLHDGWFDAGPHAVTWDGRTDSGAVAAPGVFYVRIDGSTPAPARRVVRLGNAVR